MDTAFPFDIAGRASNLTERLRVVAVLGPAVGPASLDPVDELDPVERWSTERIESSRE